ncbi:hypothetical protein F4778DRAFT_797434 [Xylariomycetidae sp. FL2044]|nr:hypothetical protein F4778DRAFT_797434 [Xylariomycetidae sp. FL2044]
MTQNIANMVCIGIMYGNRAIYVEKPPSWKDLLVTGSIKFGIPPDQVNSLRIFYSADMSGSLPRWELDGSAWSGVKADSIIYFETTTESNCAEDSNTADYEEYEDEDNNGCCDYWHRKGNIPITIKTLTGKLIYLSVNSGDTVTHLKLKIHQLESIPPHQQRLIYAGIQLEDEKTMHDYHVLRASTMDLVLRLSGGKPAIYLLSPVALPDITVSVALRPAWDFSKVYPSAKAIRNSADDTTVISWTVAVSEDGVLTQHQTGTEVSYLFWEAEADLLQPKLLPHDPNNFNPGSPAGFFGKAHTSVTLPYGKLVPYLDGVLKALTMTPAMRTEFMVYWLQSFQRISRSSQRIRLTFVPQAAFNRAAELTVRGAAPQAVARIFMLFGADEQADGVSEQTTQEAGASGDIGPIDWASYIGVDVKAMRDESTFRVLEWGGMEVYF